MVSVFIGSLTGLLVFFLGRSRDRRKINRLQGVVAETQALRLEAESRRLAIEEFSARQNDEILLAGKSISNHLVIFETLSKDHSDALLRIRDLIEEVRSGKEMEMALLTEMIELKKQVQHALAESIQHMQNHERMLSSLN